MKLSNELAQERYERLRFGLEEDQKIIEVANLDELREEGKRILKENMKEDYKVCIFAHCIFRSHFFIFFALYFIFHLHI